MNIRRGFTLLTCALLWILTACSEQPAAKKEPEKPPEPVSGLSAVFRMFQVGRTWAPGDVQILNMISMHAEGLPEATGKAGAWEGTLTSATLGKSRTFTFSVVEQLPELHKGVFAGPESGFNGSKGESKPFRIEAVKTDTDAAYKTALEQPKAQEYNQKNPGMKITYLLVKIDRFPDVVWRVIWGPSLGQSNFSVFIDASTGKFLEIMH
jgi:hypothetical protein